MLVQLYGSAVYGVDAYLITIEVNIDKGIGYHLVGLPDNAIKESNFRITAALQNIGYRFQERKSPLTWLRRIFEKKGLLTT